MHIFSHHFCFSQQRCVHRVHDLRLVHTAAVDVRACFNAVCSSSSAVAVTMTFECIMDAIRVERRTYGSCRSVHLLKLT